MNKPTLRAVETGGNPPEDKTKPTAPDTADIEALWLDPGLGDGIVDVKIHTVPIGKPKNFFRMHPDPSYRRRTEVYTHKPEGSVEEQHYLIGKEMQGRIEEAQPCTLVTVIYRNGDVKLWPIKCPKDGGHDNDAWISSRAAAKASLTRWLKIVWAGRAYKTREAAPGYAPDPDLSKIQPFNELVRLAVGSTGIINNENHPMYRDLFGTAATDATDDDDTDDL
jgi:hypothetical protein